ncbi:MAG: MFS transporter [Pseudomonadota bacterium]
MDAKPSIWRSFPRSFWAANTIEIFERMGWYGFYTVSSVYITGTLADGGLGFSSADRGIIQGLVTFFLYLFPAFFGALADKYGYKRMFVISFLIMSPAYVLLSIPRSFWGFFLVYMFVAVGHGMFKPIVNGTIAKCTNEKTGTLGFGIFYWMVNVGGLLGPIVAGVVRGWDWKYVFYCSSGWLALNLLICLLIYKEPPRTEGQKAKSLAKTLEGMMAVVGNARFFLFIAGIMTALVLGSKWWDFTQVLVAAGVWFVANFGLDFILRSAGEKPDRPWYLKPMKAGETRYLVYLLLMSGFWTAYNQLFLTLPEYIRDYTHTSGLIAALTPLAHGVTGFFSSLGFDTSEWHKAVLLNGEIKPEHLINLDAFAIILIQILVSHLCRNLKALTTIITGTLVTGLAFGLFVFGVSVWLVVGGILIFAVGEMMTGPKSQEYVGRIAPPEKTGMYMGYYYWCVALGNLFGGLLSGVAYQHFGPKGVGKPGVMWLLFVLLAAVSAFLMWVFNRCVVKKPAA